MTKWYPLTLGLTLGFGISGTLNAQVNPDTVQIRTLPVGKGVFLLQGWGGNMALLAGKDAALLIDDQYAPLTPKILAAINAITDQPVRFVVNTHWHGDHTGGNENLANAGVVIVAHDNVRIRMSSEQFIAALNSRSPASPPKALPVVTFTETVAFHLNGEDVHVVHVPPAHTDGDAIVHFPGANIVHTGDLYFNGRYPLVDLSTGGSFEGVIAGVSTVLRYANDSTKIIPGHGPLATRAELLRYRDALTTIRDRVAALIKQGKSKAEVIAAKPSAEWDAAWGTGSMKPEVFLGIVYDSLKKP